MKYSHGKPEPLIQLMTSVRWTQELSAFLMKFEEQGENPYEPQNRIE